MLEVLVVWVVWGGGGVEVMQSLDRKWLGSSKADHFDIMPSIFRTARAAVQMEDKSTLLYKHSQSRRDTVSVFILARSITLLWFLSLNISTNSLQYWRNAQLGTNHSTWMDVSVMVVFCHFILAIFYVIFSNLIDV